MLAALPALSDRMTNMLLLGDTEGRYAPWNRQRGGTGTSTSNHAWAMTNGVATAAGARGWKFEQFSTVLLDTTAEAGRHARQIAHRGGRDKAVAWLRRAWDSAAEYTAAHPRLDGRQPAHAALEGLRAVIETLRWSGPAATTDLRNLAVRLDLSQRSGGFDHEVSLMHLAELMGVSRNTARRSNQRLVQAGWLKRIKDATEDMPTGWRLAKGRIHNGPPTQSHQRGGVNRGGSIVNNPSSQADSGADLHTRTVVRLTALDAFAHRGLGGSALKVVAALVIRQGQTAAELTRSASVSQPTVSRTTRRLAALGLAVRVGEVWELAPEALDGIGSHQGNEPAEKPAAGWVDVAERLGTAGTGERRRAAHDQRRTAWAEFRRIREESRRPAGAEPHPRRGRPELVNAEGLAVDRSTGEVIEGVFLAVDGDWIVPDLERPHEELEALRLAAVAHWDAA